MNMLKRLLLLSAVLLMALSLGLMETALAEDARFDCDCTDIHMHVLPKKGAHGCYEPVCGLEHTHVYAYKYTCFDMDNPSCGKESKLHNLSCLTEETMEQLTTYNRNFTLSTEVVHWPYVYSEHSTYQSSIHRYLNTTDDHLDTMQLFLLCDLSGYKSGDTWLTQPADLKFVPASNHQYNYAPAYCCDEAISAVQYTLYKRVNLEESSYFDEATAQKIRTVVMNSYPYYTMDEMQQRLAAVGFENAELYDESVMIAATQLAVWNFSNGNDEPYDPDNYLDRMQYTRTEKKTRVTVTAHMPADSQYYYIPQDRDRVALMTDYLVNLAKTTPSAAGEGQIVITRAKVTNLAVSPKVDADSMQVTLQVNFNTPLRSVDGAVLNLTATSAGGATVSGQITAGQSCELVLEGYQLGDAIDVQVEGMQYVDRGVYFYEPYTEDGNVRNRSQNMVGVAAGLTPVACSVHLEPTALTLQKVNHQGDVLTDAAFSLSYISTAADNGALLIDTYHVDEKGQIKLTDLIAGATYELKEVQVPAGYAPIRPIRFRVLEGAEAKIELVNPSAQTSLAEGVLTIANHLPTPTPKPTPVPTPTAEPTPDPTQLPVPPTGDAGTPGAWSVLLMISILGAALLWRRQSARA